MSSKKLLGAIAKINGDVTVEDTSFSLEEWQSIEAETGYVSVKQWRIGWVVILTYKGYRALYPRRKCLFTGEMI